MELVMFRRGLAGQRRWYWHLKSRNGKKIASGGEAFSRRGDCLESARKALTVAWPKVPVLREDRRYTRVRLA